MEKRSFAASYYYFSKVRFAGRFYRGQNEMERLKD